MFYSPSSLPLGYSSYSPRRSYRPASYYIHDERPSPSAFEDSAFSPLSHALQLPVDPETRYRRALHELQAAEHDFEAHVALERAREIATIREQAAAEVARRERARAIQAEVERIERARSLQVEVEERLAQRRCPRRAHPAFHRTHLPTHALLPALVDADAREASIPRRRPVERFPTRSQAAPSPARDDQETLTLGDLLSLFAGVRPEPQPVSAPQEPTSPLASQPAHQPQPAEAKSQASKRDYAEATLNDILEFFHGIAAQARGHQSTHEPSVPSKPEPVDGTGKGKAKAAPVPEPTIFETLFGERMKGAPDQEVRDLEEAIKLSLQDRDAADAKRSHASKVRRSSPGASSSKVKIGEASSDRDASSAPNPTPASQPISPLTSIRAVRSQFSALESAFKFPPVLDFVHSELAVSQNNAPVRTYEQALNNLLEQLDAIESDGDEEVRDVRREVVREVESALEDVERKVKEKAPQVLVPEIAVRGYDTEPEPASDVASEPTSIPVYQSASPAAVARSSQVVNSDAATAAHASPAKMEASTDDATDAEAAAAFEDPSDSTATITPAPTVPASSPPNTTAAHASAPEAFLTSMSHAHFTFPPKPRNRSSSVSGDVHDDAVLVSDTSEDESVRVGNAEDGWSEVDA
ncbi:hypothetical protein F5148DRAFT_1172846 [Russula earlei]|uniref:Uncharacterized protein n=1 Tax=Russula earlei TaxID=71964 RepID=A0ACC0UJL7_9AGAM|nr:hypothetical protein F5148DRAFT_1172846 [Russula earlei]